MSANKKPRYDAKLKNLPEARQAEILDYAEEHGFVKCVAWLKEDGLSTSKTALSEFRSWYLLQQQFKADESTTDTLLEQLKKEVPDLSDAQIDDLGQRTFSLLALRRQDADTFLAYRTARSKGLIETEKLNLRKVAESRMQEALALEKKRYMRETCSLFIQWLEDRNAKEIATSSATNSDKIERLGALMFGDSWNDGPPGQGNPDQGSEAAKS
jgi:hypothetical protein